MSNTKQHIVPKSYLKAWSYPSAPNGSIGSVWVVQKATPGERALKPPANYFCATDIYTIKAGGGRDLPIEKALAMLEGDFGKVQRKLMQQKPIDAKDRVVLAFFCGAMLCRTGTLANTLRTLDQDTMEEAARLEEKENIEPALRLSTAIEEFLPDIEGEAVRAGLQVTPKILFGMNLSIFVTDDEAGFVTGDNPALENPYLAHPDVECTVPLTPNHIAFYSRKVPPSVYRRWTRANVDRINSRTIGNCKKEFVSRSGIVRAEWLNVH